MSDAGAPQEVSTYSYAGVLLTLPLGLAVLVVAAITGLHDWDDAFVVALGAGSGAGVVALAAGGPGTRATRSVETILEPEEVCIRGTWRSLAVGAVLYLGVGAIVGVWSEDLSDYGAIGLIIGLVSIPDALQVRRWERENRARLGWRRRSRRDALLHPFRSQRSVGIRDPQHEEPAPPGH
jgi:hypothetical protein